MLTIQPIQSTLTDDPMVIKRNIFTYILSKYPSWEIQRDLITNLVDNDSLAQTITYSDRN